MKIPTIKSVLQNAGNLAALATITTWLGHSITKVGLLHGFGFGAVAGVAAMVALPLIEQYITKDKVLSLGLATGLGCVSGFGASLTAASLGFAAAPITLAGAALITGVSVAFNVSVAYVALKSLEAVSAFLPEADKKKFKEQLGLS